MKKKPFPTSNKKPDFINLRDDEVIDYSETFSSFQDLLSGYYLKYANFDYLSLLREMIQMFSVHANKVDGTDNLLNKYKPSLAPLEFAFNDMAALNNPNHIMMYAPRINIDLR